VSNTSGVERERAVNFIAKWEHKQVPPEDRIYWLLERENYENHWRGAMMAVGSNTPAIMKRERMRLLSRLHQEVSDVKEECNVVGK